MRNSLAGMNAPVTIVAVDDFGLATNAVNTWRGRCLHSFTRAEVVVTETLAVLAQNTSRALVPHLVGQRFEILAEALRKSGDAPAALEAVEAFRTHGDALGLKPAFVARQLFARPVRAAT